MHISHDSPVPLYYQLREQIRNKIIDKSWRNGFEIPSEKQFCETYKLSRATVKQALDGLVQEGLIVRRKGKGSFVTDPLISSRILDEPSFVLQSEQMGLVPGSKLVSAGMQSRNEAINQKLGLPVEAEICSITRIRLIRGEPVVLESNHIAARWCGDILKQDLEKLSIYEYLHQVNARPLDSLTMNIRPMLLDAYECDIFGLSQPAVGLLVESVSAVAAEAVMVNTRLYRGDRYSLQLEYDMRRSRPEFKSACIND